MADYGYIRVSTTAQAEDGESLGVQERQIAGWAMIEGVTISDTFIERAVSASIPIAKRPEGARLLAILKQGDRIIAARLDRIFRSALDALQVVEAMQRKKVRIIVLDGLGDITANGMAKAFLTIASAFAELERETIRERVSIVKADQRQRGRYLGGKVPYGYREEEGMLVENTVQQTIIARVRELRPTGPQGRSLRWIQDKIAEEFGTKLGLATLGKIVRNEA